VLLPHATPRAQPWAPYRAWGYGEKMRVRELGQAACGLPTAALADEILLEGEGQVKALICLGGNPMMAWPDQRKTFAALQKLELLVTVDPELSATARLADYVIAPKLTLETPGMTQPIEALKYFGVGIGYPAPFAQYTKAIVETPPGSQLIEDWEFFYGLAQRMGIALTLVGFYGWGRHVESPPLLCPLDMTSKPSSDQLLERLTKRARIALDEVKKHPHGHVFEEAIDIIEPREAGCDARLELGDAHMMDALAAAEAALRAAPEAAATGDATRPFLLVPRRANNFLNSSGRSLAKLTGKRPYNPAFIHSQDLAKLGLISGSSVTIASRHDEIAAVVEADDTLRPGVVAMTHGFGGLPGDDGADGRDEQHRVLGSNTGRLVSTDDDYDPVSGMPRMGAIPISIRAIDVAIA
jgi:anaerobic selenocysteine-containing dehydrogenase